MVASRGADIDIPLYQMQTGCRDGALEMAGWRGGRRSFRSWAVGRGSFGSWVADRCDGAQLDKGAFLAAVVRLTGSVFWKMARAERSACTVGGEVS